MAAPDIPVLIPPLEMTASTAAAFDERARPYLEGRVRGVVIDLSPVSFLSSSGLSRLVDLGRRMSLHGGKVCLAAASRPVERLVRLVGLDQVMPYFGSVAEASAHLQAASPPP